MLGLIGNGRCLQIDSKLLVSHLLQTDPPTHAISFAVTGIPALLRNFPGPLWMALLRWQLNPQHLNLVDARPSMVPSARFGALIENIWCWLQSESAVQVWYGPQLIALLTKLLASVPDKDALSKLLTLEWKVGAMQDPSRAASSGLQARAAGSKAQAPLPTRSSSTEAIDSISGLALSSVMRIAQICTHAPAHMTKSLRTALEGTWTRCLQRYPLSHLLQVFADYPEIAHLLRDAATSVELWDGTVDEQLAILRSLGFETDKLRSEKLVRNLLNTTADATPPMFHRFPELLVMLAPSGLKQPELTSKFVAGFVNTIIKTTSAADGPSEAASQLYLFVASTWVTWTTPAVAAGFKAFRVEVVQMHRKSGGGGGMALLEATRRIGERDMSFAHAPVFKEWLLPAIRAFFEERCIDRSGALQNMRSAALSSGERAQAMINVLTRMRSGARTVANSLCEQAMLSLLDVLEPVVPRDDMLFTHLLTRDQASFWPVILMLTQHVDLTRRRLDLPGAYVDDTAEWLPASGAARLRAHLVMRRVRDAVEALGEELRERSIGLKRAVTLLSDSRKDGHHTLLLYMQAAGSMLSGALLDSVLEQVLDLQRAYMALDSFRIELCRGAPDFETLTDEVRRVQQAMRDDVPLRDADREDHWGAALNPRVREVAATTYRLRQSLLFRQEWETAKQGVTSSCPDKMREASGSTDDTGPALEVETLVHHVYEQAFASFQTNCKRMLDLDNPITIQEVAHILGTPLEQADADHLTETLPTELRLMFSGEPTPEEGRAMHELLQQLNHYARMRKTLTDASAIEGLVTNLLARGDEPVDVEPLDVERLAVELIQLGQLDENRQFCSTHTIARLSAASDAFYHILIPTHKEALHAADQIGASGARELLAFVRDLEDDDLRDLVDSGGDDKADVVDAITSLGRVASVLRTMLRTPPETLMGTPGSALELLGASLVENAITGVELASHVELCAANLHALTHRNKGIGDQAKANIRAIVEHGTFVFREAQLQVYCEGGAHFSAAGMSDLRSHALLGMDARNREMSGAGLPDEAVDEQREVTEHFLGLLAASEGICSSITELRMLGYFCVYGLQLRLSNLEQLQERQHGLAQECDDWRNAIREAREEHYMLSFFASRQLWVLHGWLCGPEGSAVCTGTAKQWPSLLRYVPADTNHAMPSSAEAGSSAIADNGAESIDLTTPPPTPEHDVDMGSDQHHEATQSAEGQLHELGVALGVHFAGARPQQRVPKGWTRKQPLVGTGSICFVRRNDVLETCLALYAADGALPAHSQLLVCGMETTYEEVEAFLHRAFHADECPLMRGRLFCVLRLGGLTESLYLHFKERLERLYASVHPRRMRIALISDEREQHRVSSDLVALVRQVEPVPLAHAAVEEALRGDRHLMLVTSERSGLGKTRLIRAKARERNCRNLRVVPISGHMTRNELVEMMLSVTTSGAEADALHLNILDVPASCAEVVNDVLFELLCLQMIGSSAAAEASLVAIACPVIFIELANSVGGNDELLQRLPICRYFSGASRLYLRWDPATNPYVLSATSPDEVQLVCSYLQALDSNDIGGWVEVQPLADAQCWAMLERHFNARLAAEGQSPSFAQLDVFIAVLAEQLRRFRDSGALIPEILREVGHPNIRALVARCLVDAAARFAMSSVGGGVRDGGAGENDAARVARLLTPQSFESVNYMLLLMQKEMAITVFPGPAEFGRSAQEVKRYYDDQRRLFGQALELPEWRQIPEMVTDDQLRRGGTDLLNEMINFLGVESRREHLRGSFKACRYTLTADNCLKMMLVHVRICAGQPIVISGETGCGKTSLIKFLLYLLGMPRDNFRVLNVHAGVGRERITEFVTDCEKVALASNQDVWVFFDEANTSPHLATISELMCRRMLNGKVVSPTLRFLAAVNPHRLRAKEVESVGLQSKLNTEDPMRRLVYRVFRLPQALCDYVWDYGQLARNDEMDYIANMLGDSLMPRLETELVFHSQQFIRQEEEDCSVSLRDVRRYKKLVGWFLRTRRARVDADEASSAGEGKWWQSLRFIDPRHYGRRAEAQRNAEMDQETAVVLALAHVYYCRLPTRQKRDRYLNLVDGIWRNHVGRGEYQNKFKMIVEAEQREYVQRMDVPPHLGAVAINSALLENVFVLLVCIINRMPVFLVGKPGCSKTLAMQLILENLRGKGSPFPELPYVFELRYQCSEDSTSEGIEAIFDRARRKAAMDGDDVTYMVVLDEIGLAEVSQHKCALWEWNACPCCDRVLPLTSHIRNRRTAHSRCCTTASSQTLARSLRTSSMAKMGITYLMRSSASRTGRSTHRR